MKNVKPGYVTSNQAAIWLGLSRQRVHALVQNGRIPSTVSAGHRLIKRRDLEKFAAMKRPTGRPRKKAD
jgi:excisionase family DNA binding protein